MVQQIFCVKKVKNVRYKNFFGQKNIWINRSIFSKKMLAQKLRPQKIWSHNFGQNWISNSWDYADMDKCCRDIHFLNKCHPNSWHLLKMVPGAFLLTAEIFLIYGKLSPGNLFSNTNVGTELSHARLCVFQRGISHMPCCNPNVISPYLTYRTNKFVTISVKEKTEIPNSH